MGIFRKDKEKKHATAYTAEYTRLRSRRGPDHEYTYIQQGTGNRRDTKSMRLYSPLHGPLIRCNVCRCRFLLHTNNITDANEGRWKRTRFILRPCWCSFFLFPYRWRSSLYLSLSFSVIVLPLDSLWFPPLQRPVLSILYILPMDGSLSFLLSAADDIGGGWCWDSCQEKMPEITSRSFPFPFYFFPRLGHSRLLYRLEWLWK